MALEKEYSWQSRARPTTSRASYLVFSNCFVTLPSLERRFSGRVFKSTEALGRLDDLGLKGIKLFQKLPITFLKTAAEDVILLSYRL